VSFSEVSADPAAMTGVKPKLTPFAASPDADHDPRSHIHIVRGECSFFVPMNVRWQGRRVHRVWPIDGQAIAPSSITPPHACSLVSSVRWFSWVSLPSVPVHTLTSELPNWP